MKLGWVILHVPDVPATVAFYEAAFGLTRRFMDESNEYAEMETGGTVLAFMAEAMARREGLHTRPNRPGTEPAAAEIALVTDTVQADFDRAIAAGATEVWGPKEMPFGQTVSYVRDLNGVLVEVCSPVGG